MCSLRFDIKENTIIEAFVRFRFDIVAISSYLPLMHVHLYKMCMYA
jgi:hypothetical protein